jgi:diguanylate cyclase (GGDEF)-like protein
MSISTEDRSVAAAAPLFEGLSQEVIWRVLESATPRLWAARTVLMGPYRQGTELHVLVSGECGLFSEEAARLPLSTIHPGQSFGELSIFEGLTPSTVVMTTVASRALSFPRDALWPLLREHPQVAFNILARLGMRLRDERLIAEREEDRRNSFDVVTTIDPLTGLNNRRWMEEMFERELLRCQRGAEPACILLIDVDRFADVNAKLGRPAGDRLLARLGSIIRRAFRPADLCVRYDGPTFCVLLPGSDATQAAGAAERFRRRVESTPAQIDRNTRVSYSVSIGVCQARRDSDLAGRLAEAKSALQSAKREGRNRVCHSNLDALLPAA